MEISSATLYNREHTVGRSSIGQDNLLKSAEKAANARQIQQTDKPETVRQPETDKQGRIDLYA